MRGGGVTRTVVIAYLGTGDGPVLNPLRYKSKSLQRIIMFCCGPRSGPTACKSGARTVSPDSHAATGKTIIAIIYNYVYRMTFYRNCFGWIVGTQSSICAVKTPLGQSSGPRTPTPTYPASAGYLRWTN